MINGKRILALIPARGGSKRLPRKNLLSVGGKPLIAWSIEAGRYSKYVDRVVVSTDDAEIAAIAEERGADVPFIRPAELSGDEASSMDVVRHAANYLEQHGDIFDYLLLLQPTSPLRTHKHIDEAVELLIRKNGDSVVSVTAVEHPVEWTNSLPEDLSMKQFISEENRGKRSQDFPTRYRLNGAIYLVSMARLVESDSLLLDDGGYAYIMNDKESVDIDNKPDLEFARLLFKQ